MRRHDPWYPGRPFAASGHGCGARPGRPAAV